MVIEGGYDSQLYQADQVRPLQHSQPSDLAPLPAITALLRHAMKFR